MIICIIYILLLFSCENRITGELYPVMENGQLGTSPETSKPDYIFKIAPVYTDNNLLDVVIHISNFKFLPDGLFYGIYLGKETGLQNNFIRYYASNFILLGCFLIIGLYHLGMFIFRKKDRSSLYFGSGVLLWALNLVLSGLNPFTVMQLQSILYFT